MEQLYQNLFHSNERIINPPLAVSLQFRRSSNSKFKKEEQVLITLDDPDLYYLGNVKKVKGGILSVRESISKKIYKIPVKEVIKIKNCK